MAARSPNENERERTRPEGAPEKARHADYGRADDCAGLHRIVCAVRGVYRRVGDDDSAAAACIAGVDGSRSGGRLDEGSQASFRRADPVAEDNRLIRGVPRLLGLVLLHAGEQSAAAVCEYRMGLRAVVYSAAGADGAVYDQQREPAGRHRRHPVQRDECRLHGLGGDCGPQRRDGLSAPEWRLVRHSDGEDSRRPRCGARAAG